MIATVVVLGLALYVALGVWMDFERYRIVKSAAEAMRKWREGGK